METFMHIQGTRVIVHYILNSIIRPIYRN